MRVAMRNTCVSTAMPSHMPNALFSTMFAVLRPTPGRRHSSSIVCGTSPPKSLMIICDSSTQCAAFARQKPMLWMTSPTSAGSACAIACGVGQRENSSGVTRFTPASVVWAESITHTTSVNASW